MSRPGAFAANALALALVSIPLAWLLSLEQVVPPMILVIACVRLWRRDGLSWGAEVGAYALFCGWCLVAVGALSGFAEWLLFLRGLFVIVAAGCAYLVARRVDVASREYRRFLALASAFVLCMCVVALAISDKALPWAFKSLWLWVFPDLDTSSGFLDTFVLRRRLAVPMKLKNAAGLVRHSSFFLYQGGLATSLLVLQGWMLLARGRARPGARYLANAGVVAGLTAALLTMSRSAAIIAFAVLGGLICWRSIAGFPWRRLAVRVVVGILLASGVLAVIPMGGAAAWEAVFLEVRMSSFINRTDLYVETLDSIAERPITGWGIQERPGRKNRYLRLGTHSEPLNVAYRFGWIGLGLYLTAFALYLRWLWQRRHAPGLAFVIILLTVGGLAASAMVRTLQWDANVYWLVLAFLGSARVELDSRASGPS